MKVYCEKCKGETNHTIVSDKKQEWNDEEEGLYSETKYQIIQCNGCDNIAFRTEGWFSEEIDQNGELIITELIYPKVNKDDLTVKLFHYAPSEIRRIYKEIMECYNNGCLTLCAVGLRSIIEGICAEAGISGGPVSRTTSDGSVVVDRKDNLQGKIGGLYEKGLLTKQHSEVLNEHRFLGNEAVHELDIPTRDELKLAIEIIEHTLENIYELKHKAEELQWIRERRRKRNKGI